MYGNKKGVFFTLISMTIVTIFILLSTPQADISLQKSNQANKFRIISIDNYITDLRNYFEMTLRDSSYRTISSLVYYANETSSPIQNLDNAFYEVVLNGTIGGVNKKIDDITKNNIMEGYTLTEWNEKISKMAKEVLNVDTSINVTNVTVFQTGPWDIGINLTVNISIESEVAKWKDTLNISTTFEIEGLLDPYYLLNTNGLYSKRIKESTTGYNDWNVEKLREQLKDETYFHWEGSDAPSFLMRLSDPTKKSSCCGISSLVDPNKITPQDQTESYVDYLFWNHEFNDCKELYKIPKLEDVEPTFKNFKLDINYILKYKVEDEAVPSC